MGTGRRVRGTAGECGAYPECAGLQDGCKDGAWIAQLLECGLVQGSFVPPREIREVRDLTRYRKTLVQQRSEEVLRLHGILQRAGIQLSSVARNIMGVSGRAMLDALVEGARKTRKLWRSWRAAAYAKRFPY